MKILSMLLVAALLSISTPFAFARTISSTYQVEMLVTKGDDTKEENSTLTFTEDSLKIVSKKNAMTAKELKYSDIKSADYTFSKKPRWKTGIGVAIFFPLLSIPFFFMKSKAHWLSIRTDKDFAILKLEGDNFRQIIAELETHKVKVDTLKDEDSKENKKSKT